MKTLSENAFISIQKIPVKVNKRISKVFAWFWTKAFSTNEILQVKGDVRQL